MKPRICFAATWPAGWRKHTTQPVASLWYRYTDTDYRSLPARIRFWFNGTALLLATDDRAWKFDGRSLPRKRDM